MCGCTNYGCHFHRISNLKSCTIHIHNGKCTLNVLICIRLGRKKRRWCKCQAIHTKTKKYPQIIMVITSEYWKSFDWKNEEREREKENKKKELTGIKRPLLKRMCMVILLNAFLHTCKCIWRKRIHRTLKNLEWKLTYNNPGQ